MTTTLATLGGAAAGVYSGANLLVPIAGTGLVYWIGTKLTKPRDTEYLPAIAVQSGHMLWLLLAMLILGQWAATLVDVVLLTVGVIWLWFRPGLWPVALLTTLQVFSLFVNVSTFIESPVASAAHKALLIHIVWRLMAIFFMWRAYLRHRSQTKVAADDSQTSIRPDALQSYRLRYSPQR